MTVLQSLFFFFWAMWFHFTGKVRAWSRLFCRIIPFLFAAAGTAHIASSKAANPFDNNDGLAGRAFT